MDTLLGILLLVLILGWRVWLGLILDASRRRSYANAVGQFQVRVVHDRLRSKKDGVDMEVLVVQGKGLFPRETWDTSLGGIVSILDHTDGAETLPVLSMIDGLQEHDSIVFQHRIDFGEMGRHMSLPNWTKISTVFPDALVPPYGGRRDLSVVVRLVDRDNPPAVVGGGCSRLHPGVLWEKAIEHQHVFLEKGYIEESEHRDEAKALSLKIGVAVAMADGSLAPEERDTLQRWASKAIAPFTGEVRENLRELYLGALQSARRDALEGRLTLSSLTRRLNEIGERASKYEAIELCCEIMAADGVVVKEEIGTIRNIAQALGLDANEVEKMHELAVMTIAPSAKMHISVEEELGIDTSQSKEQIRKHLRREFQKWNNRLTALPAGEKRDFAQRKLDEIAEARKRYE